MDVLLTELSDDQLIANNAYIRKIKFDDNDLRFLVGLKYDNDPCLPFFIEHEGTSYRLNHVTSWGYFNEYGYQWSFRYVLAGLQDL